MSYLVGLMNGKVSYLSYECPKRCVLSSLWKLSVLVSFLMLGGREFQIHGPAEAMEELQARADLQ